MILAVDLTVIKEFPNYSISEFGDIYNSKTNHRMSFYLDKDGYVKVGLSKNQKQYNRFVHRLVALAFIPNPKNKPEINHDDGIKINNYKNNLFWSTRSENQLHAYKLGLQKPSDKQKQAAAKVGKINGQKGRKLTLQQTKQIRTEYTHSNISQRALAQKYSIGQNKISLIINYKAYMEV